MSEKCIFKVTKFQLDTLSRFRMVEEKQEGGASFTPPPGKIGLKAFIINFTLWKNIGDRTVKVLLF